jgi:PKD repeat protein
MQQGASVRTRRLLGLSIVVAAVLGTASVASAAVGDLAYRDCITGETGTGPAGSGACAPADVTGLDGAESGLDRLRSDAVSPDGRSLYTASVFDDAVARFDRDPTTGRVTYRDCITGEAQSGPGGSGACTEIPRASLGGTNSGLDELRSVVLSPDGEWLYAASTEDSAVARFARDTTTGELTYRDCVTGEAASGPSGTNACAEIGSATPAGSNSGINNLNSLAMSPDGSSLYATAGLDDAVARFARDTGTGALSYAGCITGKTQSGPSGSGACTQIGSATTGGADSGLDSLVALTISPDGGSVYAASELDDGVARFDRAPTGQLTYGGCTTGETQAACARIGSATSGGAGSGLNEIQSVTVSPDNESLYTASQFDDAVAHFDRSAAGALTYRSCVTGDSQYGPSPGSGACGAIPGATTGGLNSGLDTLRAVATSPDGTSLYAASSKDDGVARFDRDSAGAIAYRDCTSGETESGPSPGGSGACTNIPSAASGGTNSGLSSPRSLVASPDGTSLYAGPRDDDAVARFDREVAPGANSPPIAAFAHACTNLECRFDASGSSDPDGSITSYEWDFGDGTTATGGSAVHSYAAAGTYTVTLTVTDNAGATDTDPQSVSVSLESLTVRAIDPSQIRPGSTAVTITGSGFVTDSKVFLEGGKGSTPIASVTGVPDGSTIKATIAVARKGPKGSSQWDVRVTNPDSSTSVLPGGLTVVR